MSKIALSICMPTHNFGRFLEETLDSILPQMDQSIELIILDGGSTDSTPEICARYVSKHPNVFYHRREKKGGIDRDMAASVSLARGEYIWLFSSDDIMQPKAIEKIRQEIRSQFDVYLCGFTVCGLDVTQRYWEHPIFHLNEPESFNFANPSDKNRFFEKAITTTAFFSFMGSLIINKRRWDETDVEEEFYGSCWAHAARIFNMEKRGLTIRYLKESLLLKRGFNDSFLDRGIVNRLAITIDGYHKIASRFFGEDSQEAFHIRRTVRYEVPLKAILISAKSQVQDSAELRKLDSLVLNLYKDPHWFNSVRKFVYFAIPVGAVSFLAFIYKHRSFFKYFRIQRLKHFFSVR